MPRYSQTDNYDHFESFEQNGSMKNVFNIFQAAKNQPLTLKDLVPYFKQIKPDSRIQKGYEAPLRGMISKWRSACKDNLPLHGVGECKEKVPHRVCSKSSTVGKDKLYWLCKDMATRMKGDVYIPQEYQAESDAFTCLDDFDPFTPFNEPDPIFHLEF